MNGHYFVPCLLIGIVAGLRALTAPAAVSWATRLGRLGVSGTWLAFLGYAWTPWILTFMAGGELITDQLPSTPSRTVPVQFGTRIVIGAVCGAAIAARSVSMVLGAVVGVAGAVMGTLGGHALRVRLAAAFGSDRPAALLEDAIAIGSALLVVRVT